MAGLIAATLVESARIGDETPTIGVKDLDFDASILIDQEIPAGATAEPVAGCAFDATALAWLCLHSDRDITLTFTLEAGVLVIPLKAGRPWKWDNVYAASIPNPFACRSLSCTAANAGIAAANLVIRGGVNTTAAVILNAAPFWPGAVEYGDYALVQAAALRQIALGLNTYTTAGSWSTVIRSYVSEADAIANCDYFANLIRLKTDPVVLAAYNAKFGTSVAEIPITLITSIGDYWPSGWDLQWDGVSGASSLFRGGLIGGNNSPTERDDAAEAAYIEVYHTCVQTEMTAHGLGLRELIGSHKGISIDTDNANPSDLWCPNYRGAYYVAAMKKFEQYVKWLKPVHVAMDEERFTASNDADNSLHSLILPEGTWNQALASCSRCKAAGAGASDAVKGISGYETGKDSFAKAIVDLVHLYVPTATVTFYDTYSAQANAVTEIYGAGHYLNFGDWRPSGITVNAPSLYDLSFAADPADEIAAQLAAAAPRYTYPGYGWCMNAADYWLNSWWELQPSALAGAYVWLTHCASADLDEVTNPGGYLTDEQFYDLCYALGRAGAVGFYLYPGYHGDPECANDIALDRLIPVGLAAFAAARAA